MSDQDGARKNFLTFAKATWAFVPEGVKQAWGAVDTEEMKASLKKRSASSLDAEPGGGGKNAVSQTGTSSKKKLKKTKSPVDPNAPKPPKRPLSAFLYFTMEERRKLPDEMLPQNKTRELGIRWKALEAEDKTCFQELADKDKERYEREKAEFVAKADGKGLSEE